MELGKLGKRPPNSPTRPKPETLSVSPKRNTAPPPARVWSLLVPPSYWRQIR